jgi:Asp-tRNA(Asn)/Glu-tRNA(Gln) amidotransferase A subunit family amidase
MNDHPLTSGFFASRDIPHLGHLLRSGQITSQELVAHSLKAIDEANPTLNAFVSVDPEGALQAAKEADEERARGTDRGPLHGIPVAVKDIIDVAGQPTTSGSALFPDRLATTDATCVNALRIAGAIIIGKTVLHELAYGATGDRSVHGASRNPHDPSRISGGSSGGSAVAVASGMVPLALGTDTVGSVRVPAALCGIVGFKPAFDDISTKGVFPLAESLDHVGVFATTVRDAAVAYAALTGASAGTAPVSPDEAAVGWIDPTSIGAVEPTVSRQTQRALEAAVRHIEQVELPTTPGALFALSATVQSSEAYAAHVGNVDKGSAVIDREVLARLQAGSRVPAWEYLHATEKRTAFRTLIDDLFTKVDLLALPTVPTTATEIGTRTHQINGVASEIRSALLSLTSPWNLTGHPALTLPAGTIDGLPVGLQLIAPHGQEQLLFALAELIEQQQKVSQP